VFLHLWIPWHWNELGEGEDIVFEGLSDNESFLICNKTARLTFCVEIRLLYSMGRGFSGDL
jgi:hypothetical protein